MVKSKKKMITFISCLLAVIALAVSILIIFLYLLPVKVVFYDDNNNVVQTISVGKSKIIESSKIPSPEKDGYNFAGWYEDPSFYTKADFSKPIEKNKNFYAKFTPRKLSIRVFANDGTNNYYDIQGEYNYLLKLYDANNPLHNIITDSQKNDEYILIGFRTSFNSTKIYGINEQIAMKGNTIYYAVWQGKEQLVSFKTLGAELEGQPFNKDSIKINYGEDYVVKLSDFAGVVNETTQMGVIGLTIDGGDGRVYRNGERIKIEGPITLAFVYMEAGANIVIEYNNGQPQRLINPGDSFVFEQPLNKPNHDFIGYYTSNLTYEQVITNGITLIQIGTEIINAESGAHYYAIWQPVSVKIEFDSNVNDAVVGNTPDIDTYYGKTVYLLPNGYSVLNHKFLGWAFAENADTADLVNGQILLIDNTIMSHVTQGRLTLYAVWEALAVKFYYHNNDGTNDYFSVSYLVNNSTLLEDAIIRPNYGFQYWSTDPNNEGDSYAANSVYLVGDEEVHLYAIWLGNMKTIYIGTSEPANNFTTTTVHERYGNQFIVDLTLYTNVTSAEHGAGVKGFTIDGDPSGMVYLHGARITVKDNMTLLLSFLSANESAIVEFNNGDSQEWFIPGANIDFSTFNPIREKYILRGYCTVDIDYTEVDSYTIIEKTSTEYSVTVPIIYYAIWEPEVVYVIYDANNTDVIGTLGRVTTRVSANVVIWYENYSAVGWTFLGWSKDSSAVAASYIAGNTLLVEVGDINVNGELENIITLYAVWEKVLITIVFDYNRGGGPTDIFGEFQFHASHNTLLDPEYFNATRENYTVLGWCYDPFAEWDNDNIDIATVANRLFYADPNQLIVYMIWVPEIKTVSFFTADANSNGSSFSVENKEVRYGYDLTLDFGEFTNVRQKYFYAGRYYYDQLHMKGLAVSGTTSPVYNAENNIITVYDNITLIIVYFQPEECVVVNYTMPYGGTIAHRSIYLPGTVLLDQKTHDFYTHIGYSLGSEIGEVTHDYGNSYNFPANTWLYSQWEAKSIKVILEAYNPQEPLPQNLYLDEFQVMAGDYFSAPNIDFTRYGIELSFEYWSFVDARYHYEQYPMDSPILLDYYNVLYYYGFGNYGEPYIKLYAIFNDDAAIFHFYSDQNGGWLDQTITLYVGQFYMVPQIIPSYSKLHFDYWDIMDGSVGYISGDMVYATGSGQTIIYARWWYEDVIVTFDSGNGSTYELRYIPDEYIMLPNHFESIENDMAQNGFWSHDQSGFFREHEGLELYAWQDGTTNTLFQAGWWHGDYYRNFNTGWEDITLIAEYATPVSLFEGWSEWLGFNIARFNGGEDYNYSIIIPKIIEAEPIVIIGPDSFERLRQVRIIRIPDTVQIIRERAFYNCVQLEQVEYIGPKIYEIGMYAFYGCRMLRNFNGGFQGDTQFIGEWAFAGCESLESVHLGGMVWDLQTGAFANCVNLRMIDFTAERIGDYAFIGCRMLDNFDFNNVSYIGTGSFANCEMLGMGNGGSINLRNVRYIGAVAFMGSRSLGNIYLEFWNLWEGIGTGAFALTDSQIYISGIGSLQEMIDTGMADRWQEGWFDFTCTLHFGWF